MSAVGFMNDLNDKMANFMVGRNGYDKLGVISLVAAVILTVICMIVPNLICSVLSYVFLIYAIFRVFSKNVAKRQAEEDRFEGLLDRFKGNKGAKGSAKASGKDASVKRFKCEKCGQSLSVPRGKGTLKVTCPKCSHNMKVKS